MNIRPTILVVMCHDGSQDVLNRHLPLWSAHDATLIFCSPTDSRVVPSSVAGHHCIYAGEQSHCGVRSLAKTKTVLNFLEWIPDWTYGLLMEYDAICLTKKIPFIDGVFRGNAFQNTEPNRFKSATYLHCPWGFTRSVLKAFNEQMNALPNDSEGGYMDRFMSRALMEGNIPWVGWGQHGFSANTIGPEMFSDLQMAVSKGAVMIHGVKEKSTLEAALAALPK